MPAKKTAAKKAAPVNFKKMDKIRQDNSRAASKARAKEATKPEKPAPKAAAVPKEIKNKKPRETPKPKVEDKQVVEHVTTEEVEWGSEPMRTDVSANGEPKPAPKKKRAVKKAASVVDEKQTAIPGTEVPAPPQPEQTPQQKAGAAAADAHFARAADADRHGVVLEVIRKPNGGMVIRNIQIRDRDMLRVAAEYAVAAGKSAETACKKAELTQGEGEAATLKGYAEQLLKRLEDASGIELELANGERYAGMTGLRLFGGELMKIAEKEEQNLLPDDAARDAISEVARLQRHLRHIDAPDIFVREGKDTAPNKGKAAPEPPVAPTNGGAYADDEPHDKVTHEAQPVPAQLAIASSSVVDIADADFEILPSGVEQRAIGAGTPERRVTEENYDDITMKNLYDAGVSHSFEEDEVPEGTPVEDDELERARQEELAAELRDNAYSDFPQDDEEEFHGDDGAL